MKKLLLLVLASASSLLEASRVKKGVKLNQNAVVAKFNNLDEELQSEVERIEEWFGRFNSSETAEILKAIEKSKGAPSAYNRFIGCLFTSFLLTATAGSMKSCDMHKNKRVLFRTPAIKNIKEKEFRVKHLCTLVQTLDALCLLASPCYWAKAVWKDHSKESDCFIEKKTLLNDGTETKPSANGSKVSLRVDTRSLDSFFVSIIISFIVDAIFEKAHKSKRSALNKPIHELFKQWALESQEHKKRNLIIDYVLMYEKQA